MARPYAGTCVLVTDDEGRVLIVKPTYRAGRQFPGGTVDHGEHPEACARRELAEETGLDLPMLGILTVTWSPSGTRLGPPPSTSSSTPALSRLTPRSDCRSTNSKPTGGRTRPKPDSSCCRQASSACTRLSRPERAALYGCCAVVTIADRPPRGPVSPDTPNPQLHSRGRPGPPPGSPALLEPVGRHRHPQPGHKASLAHRTDAA
ncbi:NUDIX domain-containing protein [Streptomyces virginiae]|uniref:NUDIX domain-containing protein n=1 Tax=Streptomyces virginiae TaxID=1961 RepID=UPI00352FB9C8